MDNECDRDLQCQQNTIPHRVCTPAECNVECYLIGNNPFHPPILRSRIQSAIRCNLRRSNAQHRFYADSSYSRFTFYSENSEISNNL